MTKELPGPSCFSQWRICYRLLKTAIIMLDSASLASLRAYEATIERLSRSYPTCCHLIYSADEVARSAQSNRILLKIIMDIRAGRPGPEGFRENRPWDYIFGAVAWDESFWQVQVHAPALAWIAAGSQGGMSAITPVVESYQGTKGNHGGDPRRKKRPRGRRGSSAGEDSKQRSSQGEKGKGKGGGKGTNNQRCFSWNNGNGVCASLPPGQKCLAKTPRLHRCTVCDSPGHPSKDCPKKDQ